ncbi:hypothetical protein [Caballeronia sp. LZ035]|uniref:hypothetical protein n=1 Tax=Caballeronia sp. LZ035 TaxID=3038568 RepID=UPI00285E03C9|nr:hypothetical protein [Caballeronia sp. LZ035]MDR5757996.1 hypothetical protein [Caballeronia sp. LZ035]
MSLMAGRGGGDKLRALSSLKSEEGQIEDDAESGDGRPDDSIVNLSIVNLSVLNLSVLNLSILSLSILSLKRPTAAEGQPL